MSELNKSIKEKNKKSKSSILSLILGKPKKIDL